MRVVCFSFSIHLKCKVQRLIFSPFLSLIREEARTSDPILSTLIKTDSILSAMLPIIERKFRGQNMCTFHQMIYIHVLKNIRSFIDLTFFFINLN